MYQVIIYRIMWCSSDISGKIVLVLQMNNVLDYLFKKEEISGFKFTWLLAEVQSVLKQSMWVIIQSK